MLVDGARLGLGPLLRRVPPTVVAQAPTAPRPGPVTTRPAPPSAAARGVDYSKWERFEIDDEKETRDDARAAVTPAARASTLAEQQADLERMARGFDNGAYQVSYRRNVCAWRAACAPAEIVRARPDHHLQRAPRCRHSASLRSVASPRNCRKSH